MSITLNLTTNQFTKLDWPLILEHFEYLGDGLKSITYKIPKSTETENHINDLWCWVDPKSNDSLNKENWKGKFDFDYVENDKFSIITITWKQ